MFPPVTRLTVAKIDFPERKISFEIVHDLKSEGKNSFPDFFDRWLSRGKHLNSVGFVRYVKSRLPDCIFISKKEYDEITNGKVIPATKEEYDAENN